ncbi:hypothetical protein ACLOJK_019456 [Asimina triloba]
MCNFGALVNSSHFLGDEEKAEERLDDLNGGSGELASNGGPIEGEHPWCGFKGRTLGYFIHAWIIMTCCGAMVLGVLGRMARELIVNM